MPPLALGSWYILATTLPFWRGKVAPAVRYAARADGRVDDVLTWTERGRARALRGVDRPDGDGFLWRGGGLLVAFTSRWRFVELTEVHAVTWFARASFGVTPEGMDVYGRAPDLDVGPILGRLRQDPAWARLDGWYEVERR